MNLLEFPSLEEKKIHHHIFDILHGVIFSLLVTLLFSIGIVFLAYKNGKINFYLEAQVSNNFGVKKGDKIAINFSLPVRRDSVEGNFFIVPSINHQLIWENDQKLWLEIKEVPYPAKRYLIKINNFKSKYFIPQKEVELFFEAEDIPQLLGISPINQEEAVPIDQVIEIKFNRSIEDYQVKVEIDPFLEMDYQLENEKRAIVLKPKEKFSYSTKYEIGLIIKHKERDDFEEEILRESFFTEEPPQVIYSFDIEGKPIKKESQKEEINPLIVEGKYIDIDISSQTLTIFENGIKKGSFKVSSGKRGMDTPLGNFKVISKAQRPWSKKYKLFMPWFIQFTNEGHGIHELPEWPGGYKEGANHLGIPVSHGCVRLGIGPAKLVYDFAEVGIPIIIHS